MPTGTSFSPYSSTSINVKTGSLDPADFATTRPLIHWRVFAICKMFGRPLAYHAVTAGSGSIKIRQNLLAVAYRSLDKSRCDGRDMPTIAQISIVSKIEAESWLNPPNLDNCRGQEKNLLMSSFISYAYSISDYAFVCHVQYTFNKLVLTQPCYD
jgi:hypothetical protein